MPSQSWYQEHFTNLHFFQVAKGTRGPDFNTEKLLEVQKSFTTSYFQMSE